MYLRDLTTLQTDWKYRRLSITLTTLLTIALPWFFLAVATEMRMGRLLMMCPDISVKDLSLSASLPKRTNP